jgi:hypothetical protein
MRLLIATAELMIGLAYTGLGVLTTYELLSNGRTRGFSQFGAAFALMAFTCGPHHLLQAGVTMTSTAPPSIEMAGALLIALPPGLVFIALRLEVLGGGAGDRTLRRMPSLLAVLLVVVAAAAGAIIAAALDRPIEIRPVFAISNAVLIASYLAVGWYLLETQIRRHAASRTWSLSGVALGFIFPTCALSHAAHVLTAHGQHSVHALTGHTVVLAPTGWAQALVVLDTVGLPAAIWFLVVVRRLYRAGLHDWNRRPLVGSRLMPRRAAPWNV